jgi:hypothetical protein
MEIDNSNPRMRVTWSESMKKSLITGLMREASKVQCCDGRFKKASWQRILDAFIKETGLQLNKQQLHNQFGDLKKKYIVFKKLTLTESFTVDPNAGNAVSASTETWTSYLEENPGAKEFQYKPLNFFDELDSIFGGSGVLEGYDDDEDADLSKHATPKNSASSSSARKRTRADEDVAPILLSVAGASGSLQSTPKASKQSAGDRSRYVALFTAKHAGRFTAEERVRIKRILSTNQDVCIQYEHTEEDEIDIFFKLILKECRDV